MNHQHPPTLTVPQAGELLGISRRSAYRAAAAGHIPTIRLGRRILVPTALLLRMLGLQDSHPGHDGLPNDRAGLDSPTSGDGRHAGRGDEVGGQ